MNETPRKIEFETIYKKIAENHVIRTKDGSLRVWLDNNNATDISMDNFNNSYIDISIDNFNNFYMEDFKSKIEYLNNHIDNASFDKIFFETLCVLSSPILKRTKVPELLKEFEVYDKLNKTFSSNNDHAKKIEEQIEEYLQDAEEKPVFMLVSLDESFKNSDNNNSFLKKHIPNSSTLMNEYGKKYNGEDILDLADGGYIDIKEPLRMLGYNSLYLQNGNEKNYVKPVSYKQLLNFYSPEKHPNRLYTIMKNKKIDQEFSNLHSQLLEHFSKRDKNSYFQSLIDDVKRNTNYSPIDEVKRNTNYSPLDYSNYLLNYANKGIIPDSSLSRNITSEFLINEFKNKNITLDRIIDIYNADTKYFKDLKYIITIDAIKQARPEEEKNPKFDFQQLEQKALKYLSRKDVYSYLSDLNNNVSLKTIMYVFLHYDKITIEQLKQLLNEKQITETLNSYIDKGSNVSKIKELYENYLIDYGCIKSLVSLGIITEKDLKKYNLGIPKDDIYRKIQDIQTLEIQEATDIVPSSTTGIFISEQIKNKETSTKLTDLYRILGNIELENSANLPIISHKIEPDKQGFLDGYRICPLKPASLVAFLPPESTHAKKTYILPYQEMAFILQNKALPNFLLNNPVFKAVTPDKKMHENILSIVLQFEEARKYLKKLGYQEEETFDNNMQIMLDNFNRIKTKGA